MKPVSFIFLMFALVGLSLQDDREIKVSRSKVIPPVTQILNKLESCPQDLLSRYWYAGLLADNADDQQSTIRCPPNSYVISCACEDPDDCDGVIPTINADGCIARTKGSSLRGAKPIARCKEKTGIEDVKTVNTRSRGERIKCPSGYHMDNCYIMDAWYPSRQAYIKREGYGLGEVSCSYNYRSWGSHDNYVQLYGVCVKY